MQLFLSSSIRGFFNKDLDRTQCCINTVITEFILVLGKIDNSNTG